MYKTYLKTNTILLKSFLLKDRKIDKVSYIEKMSLYNRFCKEELQEEWINDVTKLLNETDEMCLEIKIYEIVGEVLKNISEKKEYPLSNIHLYLLMSGLVYESELYNIVQIILEMIIRYSPKGYDYIKILLEDKCFDYKIIMGLYEEHCLIEKIKEYSKYCIDSKREQWTLEIESLINTKDNDIRLNNIKIYENAGYIMSLLYEGKAYEDILDIIKNWSNDSIEVLGYMMMIYFEDGINFVRDVVNKKVSSKTLNNFCLNVSDNINLL